MAYLIRLSDGSSHYLDKHILQDMRTTGNMQGILSCLSFHIQVVYDDDDDDLLLIHKSVHN